MEQYVIENPKNFILAGDAYFTVQNKSSDNHLTYAIKKSKKNDVWFVNICYAYGEYVYIGIICKFFNGFKFHKSKQILDDTESISIKVIEYIIRFILNNYNPHPDLVFYHHGKCCRCGRTLTTPESIKKGIGPFCEGRHNQ